MSERSIFESSRSDGRSDRQVIYDLTHDASPGDLFKYEELEAALSEGIEAPVNRERVYPAVQNANRTLLRERKRYLRVIRNVGYRMIPASEHMGVAIRKKESAASYLRRGVELLQNARMEELDGTQRALHEGQLIILSGVVGAIQESKRRHEAQDSVIDDIRRRVESLETRHRDKN